MNHPMIEMFQAKVIVRDAIDFEDLEPGRIHRLAIRLVHDGAGRTIYLPVLVARGGAPGPTFGVTAAIHGNEINGIPVIQRLFGDLDMARVKGTIVGCPVLNMPAFLRHQRTLPEGKDLNRTMPGRADGDTGQVYAHRLMERVVRHFDYLVDLHTASTGRENSLYVRANMKNEITASMARLMDPEIIVHNEAADGTLRGAAMGAEIPAITVEVGDPQRFQRRMIRDSLEGLRSVLAHFGLLPENHTTESMEAIVCKRSYWIYAQHGGVLEVHPAPMHEVEKGDRIARVRNLFGDVLAEYHAPEDGVVVGRSTDPVCDTGARVLHLGLVGEP